MFTLFNKETQRVPIKAWFPGRESVDTNAWEQAENAASLPFAFNHVSLMPDCHMGFGVPIGSVLATENVIVPNCVGVDIGCGLIAQKLPLNEAPEEYLKEAMSIIRENIPVGFNHQRVAQDVSLMPDITGYPGHRPVCEREYDSARKQLATLGGGNHFIEIQRGPDGYLWAMIHSGSEALQ